RFADHEVGRRLDGARQLLLEPEVELDRDRAAGGDVAEGGGQAVLVQRAGVDAPGDLPRLLDEGLRRRVRLLEQRRRTLGIRGAAGAGEHHRQGDYVLLHAVVQVALDPSAFVIDREHDAAAGGQQPTDPGLEGVLAG